jgi:thiol-disulfide isomerase/thioredoxin
VRPTYYHQDYQEQQRWQQDFSRRYYQPLNDGFSIADGSQGTVVAVDGQSRADYDKMIKNNFKYTQDNYQEAYKEAARTGKPVVAIFGGFEHNNSRQLIENSLPNAKSGAAKDAVYVYIDPAKTKDTELAKFAQGQLAGGHNASVSIVFSVKPGTDGSLQPEAPDFRWQGAHSSMIQSFNQAITTAKSKQESYVGKFNPDALLEKTDKTDRTENTDAAEKTSKTFDGARATIAKALQEAHEAKDWHDAERLFHTAIDAADKFTASDIEKEQARIARAVASTPQDSPEFQQLMKEQGDLTFVEHSKATTRAALGLACLQWGQTETDPERQQKFREIGSHWIDSAILRNPDLPHNPALIANIAAIGIPKDKLSELFPDFRFDETERDLFQYGGDIRPNPQPDSQPIPQPNSSPEPKSEAKSTEQPVATEAARKAEEAKLAAREKAAAEAKEAAKREKTERYKAIVKEDEEKAVKTTEEYYKALQDAADKGLPVIVKVGWSGCGPCHEMAPALKEQEEVLKGKAVVIRVLTDNTEDLAAALGSGQGVPITKFARPVPNRRDLAGLDEIIPERHKKFADPKAENFSEKDVPNTLQYFVNQGMTEWARRKAVKR